MTMPDLSELKRLGFGLAGIIAIAGNKKLGLEMGSVEIAGLAGFIVTLVTASTVAQVKLAGQDAAAKVDSVKTAIDVLNATPAQTQVQVNK